MLYDHMSALGATKDHLGWIGGFASELKATGWQTGQSRW